MSASKPVRIDLLAPPEYEPGVSLWADLAWDGEVPVIVLRHDYPTLRPGPGWHVNGRGLALEVAQVEGRKLYCARR